MADSSRDLSGRSPSTPDKHDAWVIWLHGLGDRGSGWEHLQAVVGDSVPWVKWSFPDAAEQRVTANGGARMRSWFDIANIPIEAGQEVGLDGEVRTSNAALREPSGLGSAVSMVHAMLTQAESMGYESTRIILGGFSQGAALALLAARLYPRPLGGVIGHSGWHLRQYYRPEETPNHATAIMLLHGQHDDVVPLHCLQESVDLLLLGGYTKTTFFTFPGEGHGDSADAHRHMRDFLRRSEGMGALELGMDAECFALEVTDGSVGALRVPWPRRVDVDAATAKFNKKARELRVAVPHA